MNRQRVWVRKGNKTYQLHDKYCPDLSEYIPLPRLIYKESHVVSRGMFSWDFLYQSLTLPPFLFFHILISPRQCPCAPKFAQNWQQNGTPNLQLGFGSKDCWNPHEKVWCFGIGFTAEPGWKNQNIFLEISQILLCEQQSQDSLKIQLQKDTPTDASGAKCRREM